MRNSSETDPSHGSIKRIAYNANKYSTADLNLKDEAIIKKDSGETDPWRAVGYNRVSWNPRIIVRES